MNGFIHTIQRGNLSLGFRHQGKPYTIGFKTAPIARIVMHQLHPAPQFIVLKNEPVNVIEPSSGIELTIDSAATLFVPKRAAGIPESDGLALTFVPHDDFIVYPVTKHIGVIIPYALITEDDDEFVFRSHLIDPVPG